MNRENDPCLRRAAELAERNGILVHASCDVADGYEILRQAGKWLIRANNPRSALWGVNHILKCESNPHGAYKPRFAVRGLNPCESLARHSDSQLVSLLDRMENWRMNTLVIHSEYGYQHRKEFIDRLCAERGIDRIFYTQTSLAFLKDAPNSLFSKDENGLPLTPELCNGTRLCVSNPDSLAWFEKKSRDFFRNVNILSNDRLLLMDADGVFFCRCEKCRKIHPVEQWLKLFTIAVNQAIQAGMADRIEYLSYISRFRPPQDMNAFEKISGVMFDTHLRFRWKALRENHVFADIQAGQATDDSQLQTQCMNEYLRNMLGLWRKRFHGRLYVFENLMMQFTLSCPQPCTRQLLDDIELFEEMGIDGIIYEAFEPGMESFAGQIGMLSRSAWGENISYIQTELDIACEQFADEKSSTDIFGRNMSPMKYLETSKFDGISLLKKAVDDPVLIEYASRLRDFIHNRSVMQWKRVVSYLLEHQSRFDWMYIAFQLARQTPYQQWSSVTNKTQRHFLDAYKLWDFMEQYEQPDKIINGICQSLLEVY